MTTDLPAAALLGLFPPGSTVDTDGELSVGGCRLADLAAEWGTPLYVIAEGGVRAQVRRFRRAIEAEWDNARMVFASKAFPCTAMYRLMAEEGIGVDVAGAGDGRQHGGRALRPAIRGHGHRPRRRRRRRLPWPCGRWAVDHNLLRSMAHRR